MRRLIFSLLVTAALAQPPSEWSRTLAQVAKYEYGQSRDPLMRLSALVRDAQKSAALARTAESSLDALLQSDATREGKRAVCLELSVAGSDQSVPALAALLSSDDTAEAARYALERIGTANALAALRAGLGQTGAKARIGIVNSLGTKRDRAAVPALARFLSGSDAETAAAAADALARIADPPARSALAAALAKSTGAQHRVFAEASLVCAGLLLDENRLAEALPIYNSLYLPRESGMVRASALRGIGAVRGAAAVPVLAAALREDGPTRVAAIRSLAVIPGPAAGKALTDILPQLPSPGQVQVLEALAERGDSSARPVLTGMLQSQEPAVRLAALEGLGKVGDASTVAQLAQIAARTTGDQQNAARQSLYRLVARGADREVIEGISASDIAVRLELIRAAGERDLKSAAGALLAAARGPDAQVRQQSLRALRPIAGPEQVPALIAVLMNIPSSEERAEVQRTLAAAVGQNRQMSPALTSAFRTAPDAAARQSLLEVMAQSGDPDTMPLFRETLTGGDDELRRGAILSLSQWPSAAPAPDLLALARSSSNNAHRTLALRGYIKLVALPSERPAAETARMLAGAQPLATQPEEKRAILSALQRAPSPESLELAESELNDPAVANEAKTAVAALRRALDRK